ncbi:hypothetical protein [Actinoplanes xinjiangensis]|nr:hypothetical protein [Actinoplanes xinjiangensis]
MVPTDLRLRRSIVVAAGVAALAVGGVAMVWTAPTGPSSPIVAPVVDERVVAGPLDGRTAAWLTVGDAAARVRVRFARLPGLLYRISTASDAGVVPVVERRGGRVTVRLSEAEGDGLDEVWIVLNRSVRWDIRLPAGAGEQQLNLRDGRVQRVEVGAAGLAEVWLPEPDGTVPVVFTGGIGTAIVSVRRGVPVRVHLAEGAGSVETPWIANNGTGAGAVLREPGFGLARNRFAIRAESGIGGLVIRRPPDRESPSGDPDAVLRKPGTAPSAGQPGPATGDRRPTSAPGTRDPGAREPGRRGAGKPGQREPGQRGRSARDQSQREPGQRGRGKRDQGVREPDRRGTRQPGPGRPGVRKAGPDPADRKVPQDAASGRSGRAAKPDRGPAPVRKPALTTEPRRTDDPIRTGKPLTSARSAKPTRTGPAQSR